MPTVAVNPAPKVYAHVVAVEKLVVGNKLFVVHTLAKRPCVAIETKGGRKSTSAFQKGTFAWVRARTASVAHILMKVAHRESFAGCPEEIEAIRAG